MTPEELRAEAEKQQAPVEMLMTSPGTKTFAWVLSDVKALAEPIPHTHTGGSMIWVKLTAENVPSRYSELEGAPPVTEVEVSIRPVVAEMQPPATPSPQPDAVPCQAQAEAA